MRLPLGFGPDRNPDGAVVSANNNGRNSLAGQSIQGPQTEASGAETPETPPDGAKHPVRWGRGREDPLPRFVEHKFAQ